MSTPTPENQLSTGRIAALAARGSGLGGCVGVRIDTTVQDNATGNGRCIGLERVTFNSVANEVAQAQIRIPSTQYQVHQLVHPEYFENSQ